VIDAIRKRPFRVVEILTAVLGALAAFGLDLDPSQQAAILALVAAVLGAGEVAQTQTTPLADPHASDGKPLVPVNTIPDEYGAD